MGSYEKEEERLQNLLNEVGLDDESNSNNYYDDVSDEDEVDYEERINHESESEEEISDVDEGETSTSTAFSYIGMIENII